MPYSDPDKQRESQRKSYLSNKEKHRERTKEYIKRKRIENRDYVTKIKASSPCTDCKKFFHPTAMDFDHVIGKKDYHLATLVNNSASTERIDREIAKCEIVCAICHRIRTYIRRKMVTI